MAKNRNGIMGQVSGKVGTIVGMVDKHGRTYFRARDVQAANPRTPSQQNNRNKFGTVTKLANVFALTINNTMKLHAENLKAAPRNAFIKANMRDYDGTPESITLGYGLIPMPTINIQQDGNYLTMRGTLPEPDKYFPNYQIALCLYCLETEETESALKSRDEWFAVTLPQDWQTRHYFVYAVTVNVATVRMWLPSQYVSGGRMIEPYETSDTSVIAI